MDADDTLSDKVADAVRGRLATRRRRGLAPSSGKELAEAVGMSQSGMSARLTGATPIGLNDLEKIAAALEVEVSALLPTRDSARAADKAYSVPLIERMTTTITRPRHLPIRCATRPAPTGQTGPRQAAHSGHGDRRPVIQPWTHGGVAA